MINYLIESTICLVIFYGIYVILFRKETFFQRNRYFLITAPIVAFTLPVLSFSIGNTNGISELNLPDFYVGEPNLIIEKNISLFSIILMVYGLVSITLLGLFIRQVLQLFKLIKTSKREFYPDYILIFTEGKMPTFSFLNYLFWDNMADLKEGEQGKILKHEQAHLQDKHTIDLFLFELMKIIFWFHPLVYLFKRELVDQHEFIADAFVLKNSDQKSYTRLIVNSLFKELHLNVVHSFNQSPIKKRIIMIQKTKTPTYLGIKNLLMVPVLAILFVAFACNSQVGELSDKEEVELKNKVEAKAGEDDVYDVVEVTAKPEGDFEGFYSFLKNNMKYPNQAKRLGIEGKVFVQFVVDENGKLDDFKVLNGIGAGCDQEAVRAIKDAPDWTPALANNKRVKQRIVIPVNFLLSGEKK